MKLRRILFQKFASIKDFLIKGAGRIWKSGFTRIGMVWISVLASIALFVIIGYKFTTTDYPKPYVINSDNNLFLYVNLDSFSLSDRLLQTHVTYWTNSELRDKIVKYEQNWELRSWISKPYKEQPKN